MNDQKLQDQIKDIYRANPWLLEIDEHSVVYIAGPMSGLPDFNRESFWIMEHCLKMRGCRVLSPARYEKLDLPYCWYMRMGLNMVISADTVVMLNGWSNSKGANIEHRVATAIENRIFYKDGEKAQLKG